MALLLVLVLPLGTKAETSLQKGAAIYTKLCAECHGDKGEGVADKYDEVLEGDRSIASLTRIIERTMPEDKEDLCVGEDAKAVASYIYHSFYSKEARLKGQVARIELQRMTIEQYQNTVSDLFGSFTWKPRTPKPGGLEANYYASRGNSKKHHKFERIDSTIDFDFKDGTPKGEGFKPEEFSIRWTGSILAEGSGDYDFFVTSENGFKLHINDTEEPFIDAWVASSSEKTEHKKTIHLLGGRSYRFELSWFKFKDKSASVKLEWQAPGKARELIPARNLSKEVSPFVAIISPPFPPDDSSVGYARGTSVSKLWDEATTQGALDAANYAAENFLQLAGTKESADDKETKIKAFAETFVFRAFRRPLSDEEKENYVHRHFKAAPDTATAIKRIVALSLKSPHFLYINIESDPPTPYDIASRLSYALWDSMPDPNMLNEAARNEFRNERMMYGKGNRLLKDERTKAKMRSFLGHWLMMDEAEDISKDSKTFPGFDEHLLSDLRTSLEIFLDEVIWGDNPDYRRLLLEDNLYMNSRLASFYGIKESPKDFEKVSFNPDKRAGVMTHPYLLSTFAYTKSTSPIHRGVFVTRNILGRALKPPPMAIEFMDGKFDPSLTMREKVTELTSPKNCQTCHSIINPLGFSLENFDAVGQFRTKDNNKPVDPSGIYTSLDGKQIKLTSARDLAKHAAESPVAHSGFIEHLFHHMLKQPAAAYGDNTIEKLRTQFEQDDFNIQKLLLHIAVAGCGG